MPADDQAHHRAGSRRPAGASRSIRSGAVPSRPRDRAPADDQVAVHQAGELTRSHARARARASSSSSRVASGARARGRAPRGAVAQPHLLDRVRRGGGARAPRAVTRVTASASRGPTMTRCRCGVLVEHVEGLGRGHAEPAPLADGELVLAVVAAEHAARPVHDLAGRVSPRAAVAAQERRGCRAPASEAEVLALALVGDRQPGLARERAHGVLGQPAQRERRAARAAAGSSRASM